MMNPSAAASSPHPPALPRQRAEDALYQLRRVERTLVVITDLLLERASSGEGQQLHLVRAGDLALLLELASSSIAQAAAPLDEMLIDALLAECTANHGDA